ncbi:MAG: hypothetical protein QOD83_4361 [Solirubrobacteraceae bacterium]|jgi:hypothetical protein|nr:hypothetical protein [Solirubrobacteraceae bacterium]
MDRPRVEGVAPKLGLVAEVGVQQHQQTPERITLAVERAQRATDAFNARSIALTREDLVDHDRHACTISRS